MMMNAPDTPLQVQMLLDGNAAAARVAYAFSDVAAIYPITPSSPMAESCDDWSAQGRKNLFGQPVRVAEMQSEAGAAGALHGCLSAGALTTTFTASQGLLLMLPDMCKMAGELLPAVFHVSARSLSYHALSIFGDHSDVMAVRSSGFALLCSGSVQEAADLAVVAHLAALESSVPFLHFFDGFRTSHEIQRVDALTDEALARLCPWEKVAEFRARALDPTHPRQQGTAQNPDLYFQGREASNSYYLALPGIVQRCMDQVAALTGRAYHLVDYVGAPDAARVVVVLGSAGETLAETARRLNEAGEKVGVLRVRLYRPLDAQALSDALPETVRRVAVLDRTRESGAVGEPLYLDVVTALHQQGRADVSVVGGRYGLGSKDFTPAMAKAVFDMLRDGPRHGFTVGIEDDVTHLSLPVGPPFAVEDPRNVACKLYGLGSDGTVGANKSAIKLIGTNTPLNVQAYFSYDSKKSGGLTVSHLRFGPAPIHSPYLIDRADVVACHQPSFLGRYPLADSLREGGAFLLNCPWSPQTVGEHLPASLKRTLFAKKARLYVLDATRVAEEAGLPGRVGTVMQAAFFRILQVIPYDEVLRLVSGTVRENYARKGESVVQANLRAIENAAGAIEQVEIPPEWATAAEEAPTSPISPENEYVTNFIRPVLAQKGDSLPVSAMDPRGYVPTDTARYEKRGIATRMPAWVLERCIQCGLCSLVCPHGCIRPFYPEENAPLPEGFAVKKATGREFADHGYRIQVSPLDCTGCGNCAAICPAKGKALIMENAEVMLPQQALWDFAQTLPLPRPERKDTVRGSQVFKPLFAFSGACAGCGETPYIKLITQLFGSRMLIANATGCSSIYGGSAPTCPYAVDADGHGPAWANSLFEDNAEFGYGMYLAVEQRRARLADTVRALRDAVDGELRAACEDWLNHMSSAEEAQRAGERLCTLCEGRLEPEAAQVLRDKELLEKKSIWMVGGDGWAYDIGYGGLDHVLASGADVNVLVLDTEVYSNTGGQASKATPAGAVARFAAQGKATGKKDLGRMALTYGNVYVAQVSMGADPNQLVKAVTEAESYPGPSLIIAYAPCIAHGVDMSRTQEEEKKAVSVGYFTLYRYHPATGEMHVDSRVTDSDFEGFLLGEGRYASLHRADPTRADALFSACQDRANASRAAVERLSGK